MDNPLHASHYADQALHATVGITQLERLARDTFRLRFRCPALARSILPGQFVMVRLAGGDDPLLGRAFALYDTVPDANGASSEIDIVFLVVGRLTSLLAHVREGDRLDVWGPLGNGFLPRATDHLIMVAGGIGQTPFLALAKEYLGIKCYGDPLRQVPKVSKVSFCYGARTAEMLAGIDDFRALGVEVHVSTDDGSQGHHGLVTSVLEQVIETNRQIASRVVCCGPEPMMAATAAVAAAAGLDCQVSLETPMACGLGICFSCVAKVRREDGNWDFERTCVEGPVFSANDIVWD